MTKKIKCPYCDFIQEENIIARTNNIECFEGRIIIRLECCKCKELFVLRDSPIKLPEDDYLIKILKKKVL